MEVRWVHNHLTFMTRSPRDFHLRKFQDIVRLKFWKSWTFPNFRTISLYIDMDFICLWYIWSQNVLLQNSARKNPAKSYIYMYLERQFSYWNRALGPVSIQRSHFNSIGISIIKIRRSWDILIFMMGIPIPRKTVQCFCFQRRCWCHNRAIPHQTSQPSSSYPSSDPSTSCPHHWTSPQKQYCYGREECWRPWGPPGPAGLGSALTAGGAGCSGSQGRP